MLIEPQNFFAKKKPWIFISTQETISGMNYYTARLFTTLQNVYMFKIIEVESASKFSLRVLWKMVFFRGAQFSKWRQIRNDSKCKYLFPSILP